jgi:protein TonB
VQRITLVIAILLHVALAIAATSVQEQKRRRRATQVAVVNEKKKEAKKEEPKPPPPPPPAPKAAPRVAPEPKAEVAPTPAADAPKVASSEAAEPMSSGLNLSNDGPGMDMGGPARDPGAGRKDPNAADAKPKAVKPVVKTPDGGGGDKGEQACTEEPTRPEAISKVEIEYTDQARADGVEGKLKLRVTISATGEVTGVEVLASVQASLDAAAIASVKQWRFKPAMRCGKPFSGGTYVIQRTFELGD